MYPNAAYRYAQTSLINSETVISKAPALTPSPLHVKGGWRDGKPAQVLQRVLGAFVHKKRALSGGSGGIPSPRARKATRKRRALSAEARAKIAAAQKARWAKQKKSAK